MTHTPRSHAACCLAAGVALLALPARAQSDEPGAPETAEPRPAAPEAPPSDIAPAPAPPAATAPPPPAAAPSLRLAGDAACEPCEADEDRDAQGMGAFLLGEGLFDVSALNRRLRAHDYEGIDSLMTVVGGEGRAVFRSGFVAGARGAAIVVPSGDAPNGMRTHFGGGFGMLDFGFALVSTQPLLLTLTGGIGGYGLSLGIGDEQSTRFDDVLDNPQRSSSLGRGGVLVGLTLGIDGRVPVGHVERGQRGFFDLGLRLGGLYGPALGGWGLSEGGSASSAPSLSLQGGYLALVIGFGGGRERRHFH